MAKLIIGYTLAIGLVIGSIGWFMLVMTEADVYLQSWQERLPITIALISLTIALIITPIGLLIWSVRGIKNGTFPKAGHGITVIAGLYVAFLFFFAAVNIFKNFSEYLDRREVVKQEVKLWEKPLTPAQQKIDNRVLITINLLREKGIDNYLKKFSNSLIAVDDRARIHLYIEVTDIDTGLLAILQQTGQIEIEIVNKELKKIQAWVPYENIEALANLNFVIRIRPPEYATIK